MVDSNVDKQEYNNLYKQMGSPTKLPQKMSDFPSNKVYTFGNKLIRRKHIPNKQSHVIECIENGVTIWELRYWACLLTDIIEKNDCAIFGTDGMGGRLYCVEIATGKLLCEMKTHFSGFYDFNGFNWYKENIVIYGKGTLSLVNPFTGQILDEYKIPAKFLYRSFLQVVGDIAYAQVLTDDNQQTLLCIRL